MIKRPAENQARPPKTSRRGFVTLAGAGMSLALGASVCRGDDETETERILKHGDKIDVGGKGQEIIEATYQFGYDYEKRHGG